MITAYSPTRPLKNQLPLTIGRAVADAVRGFRPCRLLCNQVTQPPSATPMVTSLLLLLL